MVQIGAGLSGFALYALFMWMPIWGMAQTSDPSRLFGYFLAVMMLMFGVFMVSGGRRSFSVVRFFPSFIAGAVASAGVGMEAWWIAFAGLVAFGATYVFFGE